MISIEAIFAIGGLLMIVAGLIGGVEFEKLKIPPLPNKIRILSIGTGIALLMISLYIFPQSPFNPTNSSNIQATQVAFELTQVSFAALQTSSTTNTTTVETPISSSLSPAAPTLTPTPIPDNFNMVAIESIGVIIYDNSGLEAKNGDSSASLTVITESDNPYPFYELGYALAEDGSSVSLVFDPQQKLDLSSYSAIQFTIEFEDEKTRCQFWVFDHDSNAFGLTMEERVTYESPITVEVINTDHGQEHKITIPVTALAKEVDLTYISQMYFRAYKDLVGEARNDGFTISNFYLIKK